LRPSSIGRAQIASRDKLLVEGAAQGASGAAQKAAADAKASTKDASNKAADFATKLLSTASPELHTSRSHLARPTIGRNTRAR
jgi:hypothetical protein